MICVYEILNRLNGKRYVGATSRLYHRKWAHQHSRSSSPVLSNAVKKHGWNNFTFAVLGEFGDFNSAYTAERMWIKLLGTRAPAGYNLTDGGEGSPGHVMPAHQKEILRNSRKGKPAPWAAKPKSSEHQAKITAALRVRLADPEKSATWREAMRQAQVRRWAKISAEDRLKSGRTLNASSRRTV